MTEVPRFLKASGFTNFIDIGDGASFVRHGRKAGLDRRQHEEGV
jgi:hypothetical protein